MFATEPLDYCQMTICTQTGYMSCLPVNPWITVRWQSVHRQVTCHVCHWTPGLLSDDNLYTDRLHAMFPTEPQCYSEMTICTHTGYMSSLQLNPWIILRWQSVHIQDTCHLCNWTPGLFWDDNMYTDRLYVMFATEVLDYCQMTICTQTGYMSCLPVNPWITVRRSCQSVHRQVPCHVCHRTSWLLSDDNLHTYMLLYVCHWISRLLPDDILHTYMLLYVCHWISRLLPHDNLYTPL